MSLSERDLILEIHQTPHKAVLALTGGGAEVIGELLRYGQGSNTVLEAIVPYDQKSFDNFVKGTPDKYCSPGAARDLAMAAYQKAIRYSGLGSAETLIGIGVSCSLAKENERTGREHHAYIAVQTSEFTRTYKIDLTGRGYTRIEEETLVARVIIGVLAFASGFRDKAINIFENYHVSEEMTPGTPEMFKLLTGQLESLTLGVAAGMDQPANRIIFAGSFWPLHSVHANIAAKVHEITGKPVDLEICVHNVDKPAFNYTNLRDRIAYLQLHQADPWCGDIHFTSLATFMQKAEYFPGATFVVGWDTFKRISDPKYGKIDEVVETLVRQNAKFIVFHRIMDGRASYEEGLKEIEPRFLNISQIIPPDVLPPVDMSSSKIRRSQT